MKIREILLALLVVFIIAVAATYVLPELAHEFPGAVQQARGAASVAGSWMLDIGDKIPPDAKMIVTIFLIIGLLYICLGCMLSSFSGTKRF